MSSDHASYLGWEKRSGTACWSSRAPIQSFTSTAGCHIRRQLMLPPLLCQPRRLTTASRRSAAPLPTPHPTHSPASTCCSLSLCRSLGARPVAPGFWRSGLWLTTRPPHQTKSMVRVGGRARPKRKNRSRRRAERHRYPPEPNVDSDGERTATSGEGAVACVSSWSAARCHSGRPVGRRIGIEGGGKRGAWDSPWWAHDVPTGCRDGSAPLPLFVQLRQRNQVVPCGSGRGSRTRQAPGWSGL